MTEQSDEGVLAKQVREPADPAAEAAPAAATRTGSIDDAQSDALSDTGMSYASEGGPPGPT